MRIVYNMQITRTLRFSFSFKHIAFLQSLSPPFTICIEMIEAKYAYKRMI